MRKYFLITSVLLFVLVGCSKANDKAENEEVEFINVEVKVLPEDPKQNEKVTLQAIVTMGDENVDDADEVTFEIWKEGKEEHEKIPAAHDGNGVYSIETTLEEPGLYNFISHVTARSMHSMPKIQFKVKE